MMMCSLSLRSRQHGRLNPSVLCVLQASGQHKVHEEMMATVEFTNPFSFSLEGVYIRLEGPGVMSPKNKYYR